VPDDEPPLLELLLPEPLVLELPPELLPEELLLVGVLVIEAPLELLAVTDVPLEAGSLAAAGLSTAPPPHAASMASRAQPAPRISIAWYIYCVCRKKRLLDRDFGIFTSIGDPPLLPYLSPICDSTLRMRPPRSDSTPSRL
jgi:hypothetical protein